MAKLLNPELTGGGRCDRDHGAADHEPEYASPEQVRGQHVTTATDVYSLGVILYELLTGTKPYKLKDTSPAELSRAICDLEPSKPSDALADSKPVASSPKSEIRNPKSLRGDLDNIILMALRKEPARRYKSVEQFSADIERHLKADRLAPQGSFQYRASKFFRRNQVSGRPAGLVMLATCRFNRQIWQARVARQQRDRAQARRSMPRHQSILVCRISLLRPIVRVPGQQESARRDD